MTRTGTIGAAIALAVGGLLALAAAPHGASAAGVAARHRAAVVVDLGDGQVKVGCVSFTEDHISGLEALDRASMAPVAQTYGGQGSAVCALCGKGCTAGSTCLTCKAPNYWAYYHDGTYSPIGASQSEVRDGDTEGWKWGKGERPANVPFDQVCLASSGPQPTSSPTSRPATKPITPTLPTNTPTTRSPIAGSGGGSPGASGGNGSGGTTVPTPSTAPPHPGTTAVGTKTSTTIAPSVPPPTASVPSSTIAPTPGTGSKGAGVGAGKKSGAKGKVSAIGRKQVVVERADANARPSSVRSGQSGSDSQSSAWSIAAFAAAIAVVGGLIVVFRRRRADIG